MNNLIKTIHTPNGKLVISIVLGIGLASLFRKVCTGRNCIVFKAPDFSEIDKNTYSHNNKCYRFEKKSVSCGTDGTEIAT
jgi:hypothetical protein